MSENTVKLAVYGTLRCGHGNHRLISGCKEARLFGTCETSDDKYLMRSAGGFPMVFKAEEGTKGSKITVEVYSIPEGPDLDRIDRLEGHPNWYRREIIDTDLGPAWMYIMPWDQHREGMPLIESGDWNAR